MPITELAILHLLLSSSSPLPSTSSEIPPSLLQTLHTAKLNMQTASGYPFHYLQDTSDPSTIYILGNWSSVEYHVKTWLPSEENQELLKSLEGRVEVESMFHVDVYVDIGVQTGLDGMGKGGVLGITRYFLSAEGKGEEVQRYWERAGGIENAVGGWRIDGVRCREGGIRGLHHVDQPGEQVRSSTQRR